MLQGSCNGTKPRDIGRWRQEHQEFEDNAGKVSETYLKKRGARGKAQVVEALGSIPSTTKSNKQT
jgi:hypothetical protein